MFCGNCGKEIQNNDKYCSNCGRNLENTSKDIINQNSVQNNINEVNQDNKKVNLLCILSLFFGYGVPIINSIISNFITNGSIIISSISGICPLIGLTLMIVAKIKYPENKFAKIVMWIYIVSISLSIIIFTVFMISCMIACGTMDTSGCS